MKIKKIQLKDFKRFKDLTINLGDSPKRIVALIGPNGCGKSSIFDAMTYTNKHWFGNLGEYNNKDYHYYSLVKDPQFNYNNVHIEFDNGNLSKIRQEFISSGKKNTLISFRSPYRYSGNLKVTESKAVSDITDNSLGASTSSDVDQRIEEDYRRLISKYNKYMNDSDVKPSEAKKYIIGELNSALVNCLDLKIVNLGNIDGNNGTLFLKKPDSNIEFEYNVLSSGEKEVVDILLDLYLRKDKYNDTIYIIDEPELHINTTIQRKLLIEINKMIPQNCQLWLATHSIRFIRALQDELKNDSQIIKLGSNNQWASEKYVLTPMISNRNEWREVFATALDDLSELISPKTIVYCEGKAEPGQNGKEKGFDADVYNIIFNKKYPEVLFVSSGGNSELDLRSDIAISILSKVFNKLQILVLKDMDSNSGKKVDLQYREEYLNQNPKNHRMLKRFEIENYLFDKEVLEKYCAENSKEFDLQKYDSIVKDIILDNVKDKISKIKECCGLDINEGNDKFKKALAKIVTADMNVYKELDEVIFK